ncbi:MAG: hypothetical protein H6765_10960 [Candidatus Peribacteria bacterium]|nr:MAG: hypothetical protein H6765_10960 [Candidatus Peribacteria bacterium]
MLYGNAAVYLLYLARLLPASMTKFIGYHGLHSMAVFAACLFFQKLHAPANKAWEIGKFNIPGGHNIIICLAVAAGTSLDEMVRLISKHADIWDVAANFVGGAVAYLIGIYLFSNNRSTTPP